MSLTVSAFIVDEVTGRMVLLPTEASKKLAGFERSRTVLWSAPIMVKLGLKLLPSLKNSNVRVQGKGLDDLEREVGIIRANMNAIVAEVRFSEETLQHSTQNFLDAIQQAREVGGGVVIW